MARVPVTVVSGFLGSGKTRLINHLLRQPAFADSAVIVNELGETGIDQLLYEVQEQSVLLLENGCLCCSLRSGLPDALARLEQRRAALGRAPFARLVLETSGYADPGPVLQDLFSDPALGAAWRLDSVVVTADVLHLERQLARFAMCARQLALADRIVLTMADLAPRASVQACRALLGGRFPRARVYTRAQAEARPGRLLGAGLYDAERGHLQPRAWLGAGALAGAPAHAGTVQSFVVRFDARPPWAVLQQWLGALLALRGEQVLRVKGIARIADHAAPVAVHAVHHRLHAPVDLAHVRGLPCASTFVFVTDGLTPEEVQASLAGWGLQGQV